MSEGRRAAARRSRRPRSPIDTSPNRPAIERELALGRPMAQIARKYGHSTLSIQRFRERMPWQLKAAIAASVLKPGTDDLEKLKVQESEGLLTSLAGQRARLLLMQDQAIDAGAIGAANQVSHTIHRNIELTGRYLGQFAQITRTNVNVLVDADYLTIRQAVTVALREHPEARRAVAAALHRLEGAIAQRLFDDAGKAPPPMIEAERAA